MRRIYESGALHRDDDEPFSPNEVDRAEHLQAFRSINSTALSRLVIPRWLRNRSVSVDVSTPEAEYPAGTSVPFRVTMRNLMPFPIAIPTVSPLLWSWEVDGLQEASHVPLQDPPEEPGEFTFDRGERKQFYKQWAGMFRVSDSGWEPAEPGEYTIGAWINVDSPEDEGLYDETTVRIVPE